MIYPLRSRLIGFQGIAIIVYIPYIGYPRSLNALRRVREAAKQSIND